MADGKQTRKSYSNEKKAEVMAALLAGQHPALAAKEYNIPRSTVYRWYKDIGKNVVEDRYNDIGGFLIEYLKENLVTLKEQAKFARDPDWLQKQDAADFAVLHGVLTDKSIRIIEALSGNNAESED